MTPLLLYSQRQFASDREGAIWDPVLNARGHTPARFETIERASWFARRLCADLKIAIQVRSASGEILERWYYSAAMGVVRVLPQ